MRPQRAARCSWRVLQIEQPVDTQVSALTSFPRERARIQLKAVWYGSTPACTHLPLNCYATDLQIYRTVLLWQPASLYVGVG